MNSPQSIWSDKPMSTGIAALVCYAGVFNDVIGVEEMASRLGVSGQDEFYAAVDELHRQDRIVVKDGFAGLPNFEDKITAKASKIAFTKKLIGSRMDRLRKIGRNPLVKFVGISGSLAADNPTRDRNNRLDIDIFLVTRKQCLCLYSILRGIKNIFNRNNDEPEICVNYIMDESNLLVANRNLYTATEIRNLIPIAGLEVYSKFLKINSWAGYYYPEMVVASEPAASTPSNNLINKFFYVVYTIFRCLKWFSLEPFMKLSFKFDLHSGACSYVFRPPYGGFHALVQKKFARLAETWFPELLGSKLIARLFPDKLSSEIRSGELDVVAIAENVGLGDAYSKYG